MNPLRVGKVIAEGEAAWPELQARVDRDLLLKKLSAHVPGGIYQFKMAADGRFSVIYKIDPITIALLVYDHNPLTSTRFKAWLGNHGAGRSMLPAGLVSVSCQ